MRPVRAALYCIFVRANLLVEPLRARSPSNMRLKSTVPAGPETGRRTTMTSENRVAVQFFLGHLLLFFSLSTGEWHRLASRPLGSEKEISCSALLN